MLPIKEFKFLKSKYFYIDENGWNLKSDAPEELKKEFKEYKKHFKSTQTGNL